MKKIINKNEQLSQYLIHNKELPKEDKEIQASVLAGIIGEVDVNSAFKKVLAKTNKQDKTRQFVHEITRIAAIFAIPLLIYSTWSIWKQFSENNQIREIAKQQFTSPTGMRSYVILPDGTKVWLNAESSLRYDVPFIQKNRKIYLKGEAFFNVTENKKSPFIINAANTFIEVTGTRFNVKAYPEEDIVSVALLEGSVKFQAENNKKESSEINMKTGDFYTVKKGTRNLQKVLVNIDKQIAWHNNILVLDETPLEEVAILLERWYGVKVIIKNEELKKYKFSTTFENEPLNRVLELLELSSPALTINYKPGKLKNTPGEKNYSTVTISKKRNCL